MLHQLVSTFVERHSIVSIINLCGVPLNIDKRIFLQLRLDLLQEAR